MKIRIPPSIVALTIFPMKAELVPGGDFQMYKPGTNYTVTATFGAGNSFARGVGEGIELAGGTVTYSDGSPDGIQGDGIPDIDMPGWKPLQSGNDLFGNGLDGSTGMNLFAAWGGDGRVESAEPLGFIEAGAVYTIKVMVGGPDSGPIQGPLAFHLYADGVELTPSERVDPVLPGGGVFQEISRTYDTDSIADHIGAEFTIVLGVEDANDFANRVVFDDVSLEVEAGAPLLPLVISPNEETPGNFDFVWGSNAGSLYDLVSSTDLSIPPVEWAVWEGQSDIEATGPTMTLTNIPGGGDRRRFFAMIEKEAP